MPLMPSDITKRSVSADASYADMPLSAVSVDEDSYHDDEIWINITGTRYSFVFNPNDFPMQVCDELIDLRIEYYKSKIVMAVELVERRHKHGNGGLITVTRPDLETVRSAEMSLYDTSTATQSFAFLYLLGKVLSADEN